MSRTLLAIESSTDWLSVALLKGEDVLVFEEHEASRQHASALLPTIDRVLGQAGLGLDALEAIGIATGPGSFTSLRIGLATVKGLTLGREIPAVGVSTLEAMAFSVFLGLEEGSPEVSEAGEVVALLDARRGEWYGGGWLRPAESDGLPIATLPEGLYGSDRLLEDLSREAVVMSPETPGWRRVCDRSDVDTGRIIEGRAARPRADSVGRLAARRMARGEAISVAQLEARYLRRAEAEAKRLGTPVEEGELVRLGQTREAGST